MRHSALMQRLTFGVCGFSLTVSLLTYAQVKRLEHSPAFEGMISRHERACRELRMYDAARPRLVELFVRDVGTTRADAEAHFAELTHDLREQCYPDSWTPAGADAGP